MANNTNVYKDLRDKNNELVQTVQFWKMTAAQKENEKLELMKEVTDLRLKLGRLRAGGAVQAKELDAAIQATVEEVLSQLVLASNTIARAPDIVKKYMQARLDYDSALINPRWSNISGSSSKKINKVRPLTIGGRSVQPMVVLNRTPQLNNSTPNTNNMQQNRVASGRALPMQMLLDVYIPLRRIDAQNLSGNTEDVEMETSNADNSTEDLGLDDGDERESEVSQDPSDIEDDQSRRLESVSEDIEPEEERPMQQRENPLEGPSWLLDRPSTYTITSQVPLESKSSTEYGYAVRASLCHLYTGSRRASQSGSTDAGGTSQLQSSNQSQTGTGRMENLGQTESAGQRSSSQMGNSGLRRGSGQTGNLALASSMQAESSTRPDLGLVDEGITAFSPTVRRRRGALSPPPTPVSPHPSPHFSSRLAAKRLSNNGRILKVLVAKMRLDEDEGHSGYCLPKRTSEVTQSSRKSVKRQSETHALEESEDSDGRDRDSRDGPSGDLSHASPPKRSTRVAAPSPNGATDARVFIVSESKSISSELHRRGSGTRAPAGDSPANEERRASDHQAVGGERVISGERAVGGERVNGGERVIGGERTVGDEQAVSGERTVAGDRAAGGDQESAGERGGVDTRSEDSQAHGSRRGGSDALSCDTHADSDGSGDMIVDSRPRRQKKTVVYKEKPLNRKLRR